MATITFPETKIEVPLNTIFSVDGKMYVITEPATDAEVQGVNSHGHIVREILTYSRESKE